MDKTGFSNVGKYMKFWLKEKSFLTDYRNALPHIKSLWSWWTTFDHGETLDKALWKNFEEAAKDDYPWLDNEELTINETTKKFNISSG